MLIYIASSFKKNKIKVNAIFFSNMKFSVLTTSCTCNTCSDLIIPVSILGALPKLDKPMKFKPVKKQKDDWDREHALFGQNDYIGKIFSLKICLFS